MSATYKLYKYDDAYVICISSHDYPISGFEFPLVMEGSLKEIMCMYKMIKDQNGMLILHSSVDINMVDTDDV